MSERKTKARGRGPTMWPFIAGLLLIALASVSNFYLTSMTRAELEQLPAVILIPYDELGQLGLTLFFVTTGLSVILYGLFAQLWATHLAQLGNRNAARWAGDYGAVYTSANSATGSSTITLETQKYLNHWTPTEPLPTLPAPEPLAEPFADEAEAA